MKQRRTPQAHRRLIVLASIAIVGPALARVSRWPVFGGEDGPFIPVVFLGLVLAVVAPSEFGLAVVRMME